MSYIIRRTLTVPLELEVQDCGYTEVFRGQVLLGAAEPEVSSIRGSNVEAAVEHLCSIIQDVVRYQVSKMRAEGAEAFEGGEDAKA